MSRIVAAGADSLVPFFAYLNAQLRENGAGASPLFQPLARAASVFGPERQQAFRQALAQELSEPGWRRLWLALDGADEICGHVDLRARPEGMTHRVLLGMGVAQTARRQGLGRALLGHAAAWARSQGKDWLDLEVLACNTPARRLYQGFGFVQTGWTMDMFRIDGESHDYVAMSLDLRGR
ncbi:GNAT family N-acetyltransferase [Massilia sp. TS11]|uniref:GNAT family N-acetyltransferase n=1 Tax=Massilia sp. TS11 TaxID=2908003 RepID=UPI001EDAA213|nr:GNAT family N-acetyltransferase [Massilia sp. TS11]